jgi:hypothetical protein
MHIEEKADTRTGAAYVKRPTRRVPTAAALMGLALLGATQFAAADEPQRRGWWFDAGIGGGAVSTTGDGIASGGGAVWIELMAGARLNDHWLMGLALGGSGMHPGSTNSNNNSNTYCGCNDIYGEGYTHTMLAVRYLPRADHGWVYGLGVGPAFYQNKSIEQVTGRYNSGNGWATDAAIGYDWQLGQAKTHVEAILNVEQGRISYNAPLTGQFMFSEVAASVHVALF